MEFNLETIAIIAVLVGQVVAIIIAIRKPNEDQDVKLATVCTEMSQFRLDMLAVKTNHLPHIENDIKVISERLTRIETILEERLPVRSNN